MKNRSLLLMVIFSLTAWAAAQETVLHSFGQGLDGANPWSGITFHDTRLYGTTAAGGAYANGTVYEMRRSGDLWVETVIHSFNGTDGSAPQGNVVFDSAGNLYGTTFTGGDFSEGTVFQMSRSGDAWTHRVLYSFTGAADGGIPTPQLAIDESGNLYGTTRFFGGNDGGTVFKLSSDHDVWTESTLYNFSAATGAAPAAGVTYRDGKLFGTTYSGGSGGGGTVYELKPGRSGWTYQSLHDFHGKDGFNPLAGVVFSHGHLYGTTLGIRTTGCGTVFALSLSSRTLKSFRFNPPPDGCHPVSGIIVDAENNLYGTAEVGGQNNFGMVFKLTPANGQLVETVLYTFTGGDDGGLPACSSLTFGDDNKLYGTTFVYGSYGFGVVFALAP